MELSAPYSLSRRVPSATRPPLRGTDASGPPLAVQCKGLPRSVENRTRNPVDPKDCTPSDAVLAVSRLLAPAGGSPDPAADVRSGVVEQAARFFGVPSVLLLELAESD